MPLKPAVWHYHRQEDAQRYIRFYETGISNSMTLFALRRKGKTALLLHDIRPLARDSGYNVIYGTMWDNKEHPAQALLTAIEMADQPITITDRMKSLLNANISDLSLSVCDIKISMKFDPLKDTEADVLHKLSKAFDEIARSKRRTLFLLDEIQHLASDKRFEPFVAMLRSAFDKHQDKLCALYTGSSRDGLHRLFREQRSALFNAAQEYPLPDLGSGFINFVVQRYFEASGRRISVPAAMKVWKKVEKSPYHFMAIVERMLINIEGCIEKSAEAYLSHLDNDPNLLKLVRALKPIDHILLLQIDAMTPSLFGQENLADIAKSLGVNNVTRSEVQSSIRRLRQKDFVCKLGGGDYGIDMPELIPLIRRLAD